MLHKFSLLIFIFLFALAGCGRIPGIRVDGGNAEPDLPSEEKPDDFNLKVAWSTGPMPDPGSYYSYIIWIGPGKIGRFHYRSGYSSVELERSFIVGEKELDELNAFCNSLDLFSDSPEQGEAIEGGPDLSVNLEIGGASFSYNSYSELTDNQRSI